MVFIIGGKPFKCLIDTGADRTVLRKEEIPAQWKLVAGPPLLGVGGQTGSQQTADWVTWEDPDGNTGEVRPLVASGLTANLLGQDIKEVIKTTLHLGWPERINYFAALGLTPNPKGHCSSGDAENTLDLGSPCLGGAVAVASPKIRATSPFG
ncbi:endogenous retrovirus group K member 6 Pro protein-like [Thomomys bottae]